MIRISPGCYILAALLVLILPLSWILAAVLAAIFHELCHLVSIVLLGGSIREIRVGPRNSLLSSRADRQLEFALVLPDLAAAGSVRFDTGQL